MSRRLVARVDVKILNKDLARMALEAIAKKFNGRLVERFGALSVYWSNYGYFDVFIENDDKCRIEYDTFASPIDFKRFMEVFRRNYMVLALQYALKVSGYSVETGETNEVVFVRGWSP